MFEVASTHSLEFTSEDIVKELVESARRQLGDAQPSAAVVFAGVHVDHEAVLAGLRAAFDDIKIIGGTTDGELSSVEAFQEDSVTAMFFAADRVEFATGVGLGVREDPARAAREAVEAATQHSSGEPVLCITTPEGLGPDAQQIVEALQAELGEGVPIVGGLAGDQYTFEGTVQFVDGQALQNSLPVMLLSGPIILSHGVASGWAPFGERAEITRSEGNILYEIGGKSAVDFYRSYIGEGAINDGIFPLAVYADDGERFRLRAPVAADEEVGSVTFAGSVPQGGIGQMTRGEREAVIEGTRTAINEAYETYPAHSDPAACLVFSCAGRHQILGTQTAREAQILQEVVSDEVPICGFYTYGEFGPLTLKGKSHFHNDTVVTVLIGEAD